MGRHRRLSRDSLHCLPSKTERGVVISALGVEMRPPNKALVCPLDWRLGRLKAVVPQVAGRQRRSGRGRGQAVAPSAWLDGVPHWPVPTLILKLLTIGIAGN